MIDPKQIKDLNLGDPTVAKDVQREAGELIGHKKAREAWDFAVALEQKLVKEANLPGFFRSLVLELKCTALPLMSENRVVDFLTGNSAALLALEGVEVGERLRARLIGLPSSARDSLKQRLFASIRSGSETLAGQQLHTPQGPRPPTVGNWLMLLLAVRPNELDRFLASDANATALAPREASAVRRLFALAQQLRASSATPEGVEEEFVVLESGRRRVLRAGVLTDAPPLRPPAPATAFRAPDQFQPEGEGSRPGAVAGPDARSVSFQELIGEVESVGSSVSAPPVTPQQAALHRAPAPSSTSPPRSRFAREARRVGGEAGRSGPIPAQSAPLAFRPRTPATFSLSPEDEAELRAHETHLGTDGMLAAGGYEAFIVGLTGRMGMTFPDDILEKRFSTILQSRLTGVRGPKETRELLVRPRKIGGMEFPPSLADELLKAVNAQSEKPVARSAFVAAKSQPRPVPAPPKVPTPAAPRPPAPPPTVTAPPPQPIPPLPLQPLPKPLRPPPFSVVRPERMEERPKVTDIRKPTRLIGPIEEIANLTPEEFRRLGGDTFGAVEKLRKKIDLLGKESFIKRTEGIQAWRRSPVFRLYVEVGQDCLASGKPIVDVLRTRTQEGKPTLERSEFDAIADFNRAMRL